jgi:hypothetical protein
MTRHETPLADAWLHTTDCGQPMNGLLDGRYEVDAYLLLDQDQGGPCPVDVDGVQLQMQGDCSGGLSSCPNDDPFSTSQSGSPYGQGDEQGSRRPGSTVASKGGSRSRKCTSLAQREAHKRYREKKKMNVSAEADAAILGTCTMQHQLAWAQGQVPAHPSSCPVVHVYRFAGRHPAFGEMFERIVLPLWLAADRAMHPPAARTHQQHSC